MIKPTIPNIPGIGAMTDTLDFMKNLWGNMGLPNMNFPNMGAGSLGIPGMVMPTLSVEEIHKKITDLKAVESWLALNMNMLRGTIQALEVQAATIATLKNMGESFTTTFQSGAAAYNGSDNSANGNNDAEAALGQRTKSKSGAPEPTSKDEQDAAALTAPIVNAAAWWNMLQDQFKQAVGSAMTSETMNDSPAQKKARPKAKPEAASTSPASGSGSTTRKRKTAGK